MNEEQWTHAITDTLQGGADGRKPLAPDTAKTVIDAVVRRIMRIEERRRQGRSGYIKQALKNEFERVFGGDDNDGPARKDCKNWSLDRLDKETDSIRDAVIAAIDEVAKLPPER